MFSIDTVPPALLSTIPVDSAFLKVFPTTFTLTFSENVFRATEGSFTLSNGAASISIDSHAITGLGTPTWSIDLAHATFAGFDKTKQASNGYQLTIGTGAIIDKANKPVLTATARFTFDNVNPNVFTCVPVNSSDVSVFPTKIPIYFSEPVTIDLSKLRLDVEGTTFNVAPAALLETEDYFVTINLTHASFNSMNKTFETQDAYKLRWQEGFIIDKAGNSLSPASFSSFSLDTSRPILDSMVPATGSFLNAFPATITLQFSELIDIVDASKVTFSDGVTTKPCGAALSGGGTTTTLTIDTTNAALSQIDKTRSQVLNAYNVTVQNGAVNDKAAKTTLDAPAFTFTFDNTKPSVSSVQPTNGKYVDVFPSSILVTMNEPVTVKNTIIITVESVKEVVQVATDAIIHTSMTQTLTINMEHGSFGSFDKTLEDNTGYTVTIAANFMQDKALNGNNQFTTNFKLDTQHPQVSGMVPANNSLVSAVPSLITISFSETVLLTNSPALRVWFENEPKKDIFGALSGNGSSTLSLNTAHANFAGFSFSREGVYSIEVVSGDIVDKAGKPITAATAFMSFRTDIHPPAIVTTFPSNATSVDLFPSKINLTFSETIRLSAGFQLSDGTVTKDVPLSAISIVDGNVVIIDTKDNSLLGISHQDELLNAYRLRIPSGAVRDAAGNSFPEAVLFFSRDASDPSFVNSNIASFLSAFPGLIQFTFSEPVWFTHSNLIQLTPDGSSAASIDFSILQGEGTSIVSFDTTSVSLTKTAVSYTLTIPVGYVKDKASKSVPLVTIQFFLDFVNPTAVSMVPEGWVSVFPSTLAVTFSEIVTVSHMGEITFTDGVTPVVVAGNAYIVSNTQFSVDLTNQAFNFLDRTRETMNSYSLVFRNGPMADRSGRAMVDVALSFSFDSQPPQFLSMSPNDGAKQFFFPDELVVVYSEKITVNSGTMTLSNGAAGGSVTVDQTKFVVRNNVNLVLDLSIPAFDVWDKTKLTPVTYTVAVTSGLIHDQASKPNGVLSKSFTIQNDFNPPSLVSMTPTNASRLPDLPQSIVLNFTEPVVADVSKSMLMRMQQTSRAVPWELVDGLGTESVTIQAMSLFASFGTDLITKTYRLEIADGVLQDPATNPLANLFYTITWDPEKPTFSLTPTEGSLLKTFPATIIIAFKEHVIANMTSLEVRLSNVNQTFSAKAALVGAPVGEAAEFVTLTINTQHSSLDDFNKDIEMQKYRVSVVGDVVDLAGNTMTSPASQFFIYDPYPPKVKSWFPEDNGCTQGFPDQLVVTFNEPIFKVGASVAVTVSDGTTTVVAPANTVIIDNDKLTISTAGSDFQGLYRFEEKPHAYTVNITGSMLKDISGNVQTNKLSSSFTYVDMTALTVQSSFKSNSVDQNSTQDLDTFLADMSDIAGIPVTRFSIGSFSITQQTVKRRRLLIANYQATITVHPGIWGDDSTNYHIGPRSAYDLVLQAYKEGGSSLTAWSELCSDGKLQEDCRTKALIKNTSTEAPAELSSGIIAGVVIGAFVFILVIAAAVFCYLLHMKKQKAANDLKILELEKRMNSQKILDGLPPMSKTAFASSNDLKTEQSVPLLNVPTERSFAATGELDVGAPFTEEPAPEPEPEPEPEPVVPKRNKVAGLVAWAFARRVVKPTKLRGAVRAVALAKNFNHAGIHVSEMSMRMIIANLNHNRVRFTIEELEEGMAWFQDAILQKVKHDLQVEDPDADAETIELMLKVKLLHMDNRAQRCQARDAYLAKLDALTKCQMKAMKREAGADNTEVVQEFREKLEQLQDQYRKEQQNLDSQLADNVQRLRNEHGTEADVSILSEYISQLTGVSEEDKLQRQHMLEELNNLRARKKGVKENRKMLEAAKKESELRAQKQQEEEDRIAAERRRLDRAKEVDEKEAALFKKMQAGEGLQAEEQKILKDYAQREAAANLCLQEEKERVELALQARLLERQARRAALAYKKADCTSTTEVENIWEEEARLGHDDLKDRDLIARLQKGEDLSDEEKEVLAVFLQSGALTDAKYAGDNDRFTAEINRRIEERRIRRLQLSKLNSEESLAERKRLDADDREDRLALKELESGSRLSAEKRQSLMDSFNAARAIVDVKYLSEADKQRAGLGMKLADLKSQEQLLSQRKQSNLPEAQKNAIDKALRNVKKDVLKTENALSKVGLGGALSEEEQSLMEEASKLDHYVQAQFLGETARQKASLAKSIADKKERLEKLQAQKAAGGNAQEIEKVEKETAQILQKESSALKALQDGKALDDEHKHLLDVGKQHETRLQLALVEENDRVKSNLEQKVAARAERRQKHMDEKRQLERDALKKHVEERDTLKRREDEERRIRLEELELQRQMREVEEQAREKAELERLEVLQRQEEGSTKHMMEMQQKLQDEGLGVAAKLAANVAAEDKLHRENLERQLQGRRAKRAEMAAKEAALKKNQRLREEEEKRLKEEEARLIQEEAEHKAQEEKRRIEDAKMKSEQLRKRQEIEALESKANKEKGLDEEHQRLLTEYKQNEAHFTSLRASDATRQEEILAARIEMRKRKQREIKAKSKQLASKQKEQEAQAAALQQQEQAHQAVQMFSAQNKKKKKDMLRAMKTIQSADGTLIKDASAFAMPIVGLNKPAGAKPALLGANLAPAAHHVPTSTSDTEITIANSDYDGMESLDD